MAPVMHVDMDAFYAAVELRRHPELATVPMWVGGARRGVVLSANYPARARGVRSGMAVSQALRCCPEGVGIRPDFESYVEVSAGVRKILDTITPRVDMTSIDEAYLELSATSRSTEPAALIGERIRALVYDEQGITCSVGIGPNRLVAKMASVAAKPDGLLEVHPDDVVPFLHPLPVERLVGVGQSTAERLHRLGVVTIADLACFSRPALRQAFGPHAGTQGLLHLLVTGWVRRPGGPVWS